MSFSAGVFSINSSGQPVVTGTVISSTVFNALTADLATGLSTCILKDGTQTITANVPMSGFKFTGLAAGSANGNSLRFEQLAGLALGLTAVAGTNTITATASPSAAYAVGQSFFFIPANANTGATTININGLGAKDIFANGAACYGGELVAGIPAEVYYDGTQFNVVNPARIRIGVSQNTASGTEVDFTGLPAGLSRITIMLSIVSTNGTANPIIQIGSGSYAATNYFGGSAAVGNASPTVVINNNTGFLVAGTWSAAAIGTGVLVLTRYSGNSWMFAGNVGRTDAAVMNSSAGVQTLGGALDRLRLTTDNGTDAFDAGSINIAIE